MLQDVCLLLGDRSLKLDTAYKHRLHNHILDEVLYTDKVTTSVSAGGEGLFLSNPVHLIINVSVYILKKMHFVKNQLYSQETHTKTSRYCTRTVVLTAQNS